MVAHEHLDDVIAVRGHLQQPRRHRVEVALGIEHVLFQRFVGDLLNLAIKGTKSLKEVKSSDSARQNLGLKKEPFPNIELLLCLASTDGAARIFPC